MVNINKDIALWDDIFRIPVSKIPFPSKLSIEYYAKIKSYFPSSAKLLEAGSGSGEISGYLAKKGHDVYLLDKSQTALDLSKKLFSRYRLRGTFLKGDLFSIPYPNNTFDCVWNSGVLEHFQDKEVILALKEMSRVSKNLIITLVPSSTSVIYRIAKWHLERLNKWPFGEEFPKYTLRPQFKASNLNVLEEDYLGAYSGILWLKEIFKTRNRFLSDLSSWAESLDEEPLRRGISYLLITVGTKKNKRKIRLSPQVNFQYELYNKEIQIADLKSSLDKAKNRLQSIEQSRFWKLYRLLKRIRNSVRSIL